MLLWEDQTELDLKESLPALFTAVLVLATKKTIFDLEPAVKVTSTEKLLSLIIREARYNYQSKIDVTFKKEFVMVVFFSNGPMYVDMAGQITLMSVADLSQASSQHSCSALMP